MNHKSYQNESLYYLYKQRLTEHVPHGVGHDQKHHGIRYSGSEGDKSTAEERVMSIAKKTGDEITEDKETGQKFVKTENPTKSYEFDNWDDVEDFERKQLDKQSSDKPIELPPLPSISEEEKPSEQKKEPQPKALEPSLPQKKPDEKKPPIPPVKPPTLPTKKTEPPKQVPVKTADYMTAEKQAAKTTQKEAADKGLKTSVVNNKVVITLPDGSTAGPFDDWEEAQKYVDKYEPPPPKPKESINYFLYRHKNKSFI